MPGWIFGHGKRIKKVEDAVVTLDKNLQTGFDRVLSRIDEIDSEIGPETPSDSENFRETPGDTELTRPLPMTPSPVYEQSISKLDQELLRTTDPLRIQELLESKKMIRGYRNRELNARRLALERRRHPQQRYEDEEVPAYPAEQVPEAEVERIANQVGVSKEGQLDPQKLFTGLTNLVNKPGAHTIATKIAKQLGIDDLDGALRMLGQVVADPNKSQELAAAVGTGLAGVVKDRLTPYITPKPPPTGPGQYPIAPQQTGERPRAADGFLLFMGPNGQWIDPRKPYVVSSGMAPA